MQIEPAAQAKFERNYIWERSWPKSMFVMLAITEILLGVVVFVTEVLNIAADFWHTNIFGGIWASTILFVNWILIFVTVCCATTVRAATCAFVWNFITLIAFGALIIFDVIFLNDPSTCLLSPTCSSQSQVISVNVLQNIPQFSSYSTSDSKKFFLKIQVASAATAFAMSILYIIIFLVCKIKLRKQKVAPQMPAYNPPPPRREKAYPANPYGSYTSPWIPVDPRIQNDPVSPH